MCLMCSTVLDPDLDYVEFIRKAAHLAITDEVAEDHFDSLVEIVKKEYNLSTAEIEAILTDDSDTVDDEDYYLYGV